MTSETLKSCPFCGGALHEGKDKSRWHELFGTPERVAQTLIETCIACEVCGDCKKCPLSKAPFCTTNIDYTDYDVVLEWLESEACDD